MRAMTIEYAGRRISKIGVVGSGHIGPDIALHFSKAVAGRGVPVVVQDIAADALERGRRKIEGKLSKGVESGAFRREEAEAIRKNLVFTQDASALGGSDLVIEAATENLAVKQTIFENLERICPETGILASNSSHLEPETIFERSRRPERCLVIHYFFPAERNLLVEVVPSNRTSEGVTAFCLGFYEAIGKVPIRVKSRYGYAMDPIFEGLFLAAALLVQEGVATTKQVDAVAQRALGLGVGPFTAMNLTGGNPITRIGLGEYHRKIMEWFHVPRLLEERIASGQPWEVPARGEQVDVPAETERTVRRRLLGAYFGLAGEVLEAGLVDAGDLDMGVELALVAKPPLSLMNETPEWKDLVTEYAAAYPSFRVARILQTHQGPWKIPLVRREDREDVAVLTIKRPRVLNALNAEVVRQLDEQMAEIRADGRIRAVVLTGFGTKAFVSGADLAMLASIRSPEDGVEGSRRFQEIFRRIETLGKPVVCAMNGLALGGGSELALACTARIARRGLKVLAGQPEVRLGIIPGAGATQRLPRLIPFEEAWKLLRTGESISSERALDLGYVSRLAEGDLLAEAVQFARDLAAGRAQVRTVPEGPVDVPTNLPEVELRGVSRKIDGILCRAILEGARMSLEEGLRLETQLWGEVCRTEDWRIGLENFRKTGGKQPAPFVDR